jgi:hypothetical protein
MASANSQTHSRHEIKLTIDNIPPNTVVKRVFSTNAFIPMTPKIRDKDFLYYTGFIKLVETFKVRTKFDESNPDKKWYLYVYYDAMFDLSYNDDHYKPNEPHNNYINTLIKTEYNKNKDNLLKLHTLYKLFLEHIRNNKEIYNFIRVYSFNFPDVYKKNKGYLGHPLTLGSIVRAEPLYDKSLDYVFMINVSHAITPKLMDFIKNWIQSDKIIILNTSYSGASFENTSLPYFILSHPLNTDSYDIKYALRPLAGLFGYKQNNGVIDPIDYKLFIHTDKKNGNFEYGFDEAILSFMFRQFTYQDREHKKVLYFNNEGSLTIYKKFKMHMEKPYLIYGIDEPKPKGSYANMTTPPLLAKIQNSYAIENNNGKIPVGHPIIELMNGGKHLNYIINMQNNLHRMIGTDLMNDLPESAKNIYREYLESSGNYTVDSLLASYDEQKPYIILLNSEGILQDGRNVVNISKESPVNKYYTCVQLNSFPLDKIEILFKSTLDYYQTMVNKVPYIIRSVIQGGSSSIYKKKLKKTKHTKTKNTKTKHTRTKHTRTRRL